MTTIRNGFALTLVAALGACGSIPTRTFTIDAIDTSERPVPCVVVVDSDWEGAVEKNQLVNVGADNKLSLKVEFNKPEVEIFVVAVKVDSSTGEVRVMPKSRTESTALTQFLAGTRRLRLDDPDSALFILRRAR